MLQETYFVHLQAFRYVSAIFPFRYFNKLTKQEHILLLSANVFCIESIAAATDTEVSHFYRCCDECEFKLPFSGSPSTR